MVYEVEARSFISKEKYEDLAEFFSKSAKFLGETDQESHYLDSDKDLRIQKNDDYCKVWLKKGKMHESNRQELEIKFDKKDFSKLQELFLNLGFNTKIKWYRKRREYLWKGFNVCLDFTKGYGYILEIEKLCKKDDENKSLNEIKSLFKMLGIKITPKKEFDEKFKHYEKNWRNLTKV